MAPCALTKRGFRAIRNFFIMLAFLSLIGVFLAYLGDTLESPEEAAEMIRGYGALGPVVVVLLITLEVIVAPIPGFLIAAASGFVFGTILGAIYSYAGNIIGTAAAFLLARRYGRPLVESIIAKNKIRLYDSFFRERGVYVLWLVFLFPVFPADIVSFVTGMSDVRFRTFMTIAAIAYMPNMLMLNYFGANLFASGFGAGTLVSVAVLALVLLFGALAYHYLSRRVADRP